MMRLGLGYKSVSKITRNSIATYYPNSTGSISLKRINDTVPGDSLSGNTNNELDSGWLDVISTDDENYYMSSASNDYGGNRVVIQLSNTDINEFTIIAKGYGTGGAADPGWRLYVWNANLGSWGTVLDSHVSGSKDTLTATINSNVTNYIDSSDKINVLVTAHTGTELAGTASYLYYFELTTA